MDEQVDIPQDNQQVQTPPDQTPTTPALSPDKRTELHGIVSKMILNKESEDNIKLVIDHYTKKNLQAPIPVQQTPTAPLITPMQQAADKHNKVTNEAINTIHDVINKDENIKPVAQDMLVKDRQQALQDAANNVNVGATDHPVHIPTQFGLKVEPQETDQLVQGIRQNPALQEKALIHAAKTDPAKAKDIDKALYVYHSTPRATTADKQNEIADNADKISKGELEYNPINKRLTKPQGFGDSFNTAYDQRENDMKLFDLADNGSKEDVIKKLNSDLSDQSNPDKPVPVPNGTWSSIGGFAGGQGKITAEATAAQALNLLAPGSGEVVSAGLYAHEMGRRGFANELRKSYAAFKQQGLPDSDAYDKAEDQAKKAMLADATTGAVMGKTTGGAAAKTLESTAASAGKLATEGGWYQGVIKNAYNHIKQETPLAARNASLAGGGELAKNIAANAGGENRDITEGVGEAAANMAALHYTISSAVAVAGKIGSGAMEGAKTKYKQLMQGISKFPVEDIKTIASQQVADNLLTPQEAATVVSDAEQHKELDALIPKSVKNDEVRLKLQDIVKKREATAEEKSQVSAAFAEPLKMKIEGYDNKINEIVNSPEAKQETPKPEPEHTESYAKVVNIKPKEEPEVSAEAPPVEETNGNTIGIAHDSQESRASKLGQEKPERGEGVTVEETVNHGRKLLSDGGDPEKSLADFQKDKKISYDDISLVRAHLEKLAKATNDAHAKYGEGSPEVDAAKQKEQDWRKQIKPMQTEWAKIGTAQQGETDIDTGSVMGLQRAFTDTKGRGFTAAEEAQAKEHVKTIAEKDKTIADLQKKLDEAHTKNEQTEGKNIKQKAKDIATVIRKGKLSRPDSFSAATPASLVWDGAVETAAKVVEATGTVAQAIADGVEHIKASEWYKGLSEDKQKNAINDFTEHVKSSDKSKSPIEERFVDKKDNKFSADEAKAIWEHTKKYLDNGSSYVDAVKNVSTDTGLSPEQVRRAIATPKGTREISDEIYIQNSRRNEAINKAKQWVKKDDAHWAIKFAKALPRFFFADKVFGHGSVGMITHAGSNIFRPSKWQAYWPNFIRQFKFSFGSLTKAGEARYAKAMEDLKSDPQFTMWKRAGLAVDPKIEYDEYEGGKRMFGKLGLIGDRGFNALKTYRLDMAKLLYNRLSDATKADPETPATIAEIVNHSSGSAKLDIGQGKVSKVVNTMFFAPRLEASRWHGLILDPAKAVKTFATWKNATPSEKVAAKTVVKKGAEIMATYYAGLLANGALLSAMGSKQKINYTDPSKSDWLKYKIGGKTIDVSGGVESSMKLLGTLIREGYYSVNGTKKDLKEKPQETDEKTIGQQVRYKLSPFGGILAEGATGTDAIGNVMPWSNIKPSAGKEKLTYAHYFTNMFAPIPVEEAIKTTRESMKEHGMSDVQIDDVLKGIFIGAVSGGTGARVDQDYGLTPKPGKPRKGGAEPRERQPKGD